VKARRELQAFNSDLHFRHMLVRSDAIKADMAKDKHFGQIFVRTSDEQREA
jgi:hypothetical protein